VSSFISSQSKNLGAQFSDVHRQPDRSRLQGRIGLSDWLYMCGQHGKLVGNERHGESEVRRVGSDVLNQKKSWIGLVLMRHDEIGVVGCGWVGVVYA